MGFFLDDHQIVTAIPPCDLDTDRVADYVSLKNYGKVVLVVTKAVGTAGDDLSIDFQQATDVSGTSAKDLDVITTYWRKAATTDLTAVGTFTKITQSAASELYSNAAEGAKEILLVAEVNAEQLDQANGFDCVSANIILDASGGAAYGAAVWILCDPRYPQADGGLSAIAD